MSYSEFIDHEESGENDHSLDFSSDGCSSTPAGMREIFDELASNTTSAIGILGTGSGWGATKQRENRLMIAFARRWTGCAGTPTPGSRTREI